MEWLIIIGGIVLACYVFGSPKTKDDSGDSVGGITVKATFENGQYLDEPIDSGPITETRPGEYVINPASPLPLTLRNCSKGDAQEIKKLLDGEAQWNRTIGEITFLFAAENIGCVELDRLLDNARHEVSAIIENLKNDSTEWKEASEKDKLDLMREFEKTALEKLTVKPADTRSLDTLLFGQPGDITVDDDLLDIFSGNRDLYQFYISHLGTSKPRQVAADDYNRARWESLVELGMAKRGKDIPVESILETLRVKDINEYFGDRSDKKLTRKAQAIEFAASQPDVMEVLSKHISFRELFQISEPPSIDITELKNCFKYANAQAEIIRDTFVSGCRTLRTLQDAKESIFDGWEIDAEDCCANCYKSHGRKTKRQPKALPPFHIGCICSIEEAFD